MDNAQVYIRRPRLLDEELDDEKEVNISSLLINVTSSQSSMVMSVSNLSNTVNDVTFSPNKTDSEKFIEIQEGTVNKNLACGKASSNDKINNNEPFGKPSLNSIPSIDLHDTENVILRRQRVEEWIQNNSHLSVAASNQNHLNVQSNDIACLSEIASPMIESCYENSSIAQLDATIRNFATDDRTEQLYDDNKIDLAQMEYNVKQFLLKQNEWSMNKSLFDEEEEEDDDDEEEVSESDCMDEISIKMLQRTETNL